MIYIAFPNILSYPTALADMSECTIEKCPQCGKDCWVSKKKKTIIEAEREKNNEIYCACHICFKEEVFKNPSLLEALKESSICRI